MGGDRQRIAPPCPEHDYEDECGLCMPAPPPFALWTSVGWCVWLEPVDYLATDVSAAAWKGLFSAAADLAAADPWNLVTGDYEDLLVSSADLGLEGAVVHVSPPEAMFLSFFETVEEYKRYYEDEDDVPRPLLHYAERSRLRSDVADEIDRRGWKLLSKQLYPGVERDPPEDPVSTKDVLRFEAVALALAEPLQGPEDEPLPPEVRHALLGVEPITRQFTVQTHAGAIDIELRVPLHRVPTLPQLFEEFAGLDEDDSTKVTRQLESLEAGVLRHFNVSPEGESLSDFSELMLVLQWAADYFDVPLHRLNRSVLGEVLFDVIPRKASVAPEAASSIIEQTRAFFRFLARATPHVGAAECLEILDDAAVTQLRRELDDPSNFDPGKGFVMAGMDAGYDMATQEGMEAWTRAFNRGDRRTPVIEAVPPPPEVKRARQTQKREKKKKRKARKRNR